MSLTDFPGGRDGWHITSGTYPNPNVQDLLADVRKGTGRMTCERQERDWQDDLCDAGQRDLVVSITATVPAKHFYQLEHADDHGADVEKEAAQDAI